MELFRQWIVDVLLLLTLALAAAGMAAGQDPQTLRVRPTNYHPRLLAVELGEEEIDKWQLIGTLYVLECRLQMDETGWLWVNPEVYADELGEWGDYEYEWYLPYRPLNDWLVRYRSVGLKCRGKCRGVTQGAFRLFVWHKHRRKGEPQP